MAAILNLRYRVLTPLFLGGADQRAELRAASIKGALRFWYRAVDPSFAEGDGNEQVSREQRFFGSTADVAGQSPFQLRVTGKDLGRADWSGINPRRFDRGQGRQTRNGLVYLGFPFGMRGVERDAIAPGQFLELRCLVRREGENQDFRRALVAACWLLGHIGGLGSRSRRGFGALALTEWKAQPQGAFPECAELPLLGESTEPTTGRSGFATARSTFQQWFGDFGERARRPHLGKAFQWVLTEEGFPSSQWDVVMDRLGRSLQDFRLRREPDYSQVRAHLEGTGRLTTAPERAAFGLPLAFRYSSVRGTVEFLPFDEAQKTTHDRQGSLLFLRPIAVADRLHPLYVRLDGDAPGMDSDVALRRSPRKLLPPRHNVLDAFMAHIARET